MTITTEQIQELRAWCDAATPGPWKEEPNLGGTPCVISEKTAICCTYRMGGQASVDAAFIAASRTALPQLLDEVSTLRAQLAEAQMEIDRLRGYLIKVAACPRNVGLEEHCSLRPPTLAGCTYCWCQALGCPSAGLPRMKRQGRRLGG